MRTADKYVRARVEASLTKHGIRTFQGGTVDAYLNHGRWVADCPCNGAELVAPGLEMVCGSCGAVHQVRFPKKSDRQKIEAACGKRPVLHQNWSPAESVGELEAQNIENGIWDGLDNT